MLAAAWGLVVLGEWASAARRARWHLDEIAPPLAEVEERTGPWDMPVAAPTVIEAAPDPESLTVVAKLPAMGARRRASSSCPRSPSRDEWRRFGVAAQSTARPIPEGGRRRQRATKRWAARASAPASRCW